MTYCSVVAVLSLVGLTKKLFYHHAILKILSLRSPRSSRKTSESHKTRENAFDKTRKRLTLRENIGKFSDNFRKI